MSLFVVNRYDDREWEKPKSDSSQDHLSELLKKIQERKQKRELEADAPKVELKIEPDNNNKKKRKKNKSLKRKLDALDDVDSNNHDENDVKTQDQEKTLGSHDPDKQDFTVLGSHKRVKSQVAKRILPTWLKQPEIVSSELKSGPSLSKVSTFMDSKLVKKLEQDSFHQLFPVQSRVFSWLLQCDQDYKAGRWVRDTCVSMPTGSGKTLAYVLPIIQLLQNKFVRFIRCLIVLPVQELATQVFEVVLKYSANTSLKVALISGASSFKEEQERLVQKTENGDYLSRVDIVVATPGRLVDHIRKTNGFSLTALRFLVIDEADRSTDWLQYIPFPHQKAPPLTITNIRDKCNVPAQKLLLSATLSQDPEKLSRLGLFRPILFTSAVVDLEKLDKDLNLDEAVNKISISYGNPSELSERIVECDVQYKPLAVYKLIIETEVQKTLIFTNSGESAHRLAVLLQLLLEKRKVFVTELSAILSSKQREETLEKFKQGTSHILVSSDALARGLDIPGVKLVISYDLPKHVKGYIHRAGRTGRGGIPGTAVSTLSPTQTAIFINMMKKVGKAVPAVEKEDLKNLAESVNYESHLESFKTFLEEQQETTLRRLKSQKRFKTKR